MTCFYRYRLLVTVDGSEKSRLCSMLALKKTGFSLADVPSDVLLSSRIHTTAFSTDQQLWCFVVCLPMCYWCAASSRWCRGRTCVLYNVHTFLHLHQLPTSVVNWVSGSTGMFGGHRPGEIKSGVSCWRSGLFHEHTVTSERVISVTAIFNSK